MGTWIANLWEHEGYTGRKLADGTITSQVFDYGPFVSHVAACDCGDAGSWYGSTEYPPTEAGEEAALEQLGSGRCGLALGEGLQRADWPVHRRHSVSCRCLIHKRSVPIRTQPYRRQEGPRGTTPSGAGRLTAQQSRRRSRLWSLTSADNRTDITTPISVESQTPHE